jgi:hypothetical protein
MMRTWVVLDLRSDYNWCANVVAIAAACEADNRAGYGKRETFAS